MHSSHSARRLLTHPLGTAAEIDRMERDQPERNTVLITVSQPAVRTTHAELTIQHPGNCAGCVVGKPLKVCRHDSGPRSEGPP